MIKGLKAPVERLFLMFVLLVIFIFSLPFHVRGEIVDRIVAIVNDDCITLSELKERAREILLRTGQGERSITEPLLAQLLPQVIDQYLIKKEVEARGIQVTDREVEAALKDILSSNQITLDELQYALKKEGKTIEDYKEDLKTQIEHSRLVSSEVRGQIVVTDEEVDNYLKEHPVASVSKGPVYVLEAIDFPFSSYSSQDEAKKRANEALSLLKGYGGGSHNADKTKAEAIAFKELGSFSEGEMAPFLKKHITGLKKGAISDIVKGPSGYHIFKVKDILLSDTDTVLAKKLEIRQRLMKEKLNRRFEEWLQELRNKASIRILL